MRDDLLFYMQFRVRVRKEILDDATPVLAFEHPVKNGADSGGWMERELKPSGETPDQRVRG